MAAPPEPGSDAEAPRAKPSAPGGAAPGASQRGSPASSAGRGGGGGGGGVTSRGSPLAFALGGALLLAVALLGVCLWQARAGLCCSEPCGWRVSNRSFLAGGTLVAPITEDLNSFQHHYALHSSLTSRLRKRR